MIKITFLIYGDINQTSGGYYYDRELIKALSKRGHSVRLAEAGSYTYDNDQTDIYIIDELCHPEFCRKNDFKRLKKGAPVTAMVHHLAADEDINKLSKIRHLSMERSFFKRINYAIFNSLSTRNSTQRKAGYAGSYEIAVPGRREEPGVEKVITENPAFLSLLYLGNVIPRKSLHHVIRHLSGISDMPYKLIIAGDTSVDREYTRKLELLILKNNLGDKVELLGRVTEGVKDELLADADLLIMPSSHEGYGIAYIEAMRYGIIPVAGVSGGASEIIRKGENGYLIEPNDGRQLQALLELLWKNPSLKNEISRNASASWAEHPLWERTFDKVINELEKLVL